MLTLGKADFDKAYEHVAPYVHRTPILASRTLSEVVGREVFLKAEMFQKVGSYKVRGPLNVLANMPAERKERGIICSSAGNHAQGVAFAARMHRIPATVVMAENASPGKVQATRDYGAEVILHGRIWDDAYERSLEIQEERGLVYVHPFDDPDLIAGQGTLGLELIEDLSDVDVVVVPIGGGGLISGVSMAVKAVKPGVRIIGVESSGAPAMKLSVEAGRRVRLDEVTCVVDGLVVKMVGENTLSVVSRFVDDIVLVSDEEIFETVVWLMERCKLVTEGAAAAPVCALRHGRVPLAQGAKVAEVEPRGEARFCIGIGERPGRIAQGVLEAVRNKMPQLFLH